PAGPGERRSRTQAPSSRRAGRPPSARQPGPLGPPRGGDAPAQERAADRAAGAALSRLPRSPMEGPAPPQRRAPVSFLVARATFPAPSRPIFWEGPLGKKPLILLERVKGIEPSSSAWKAVALPLSYTRTRGSAQPLAISRPDFLIIGL